MNIEYVLFGCIAVAFGALVGFGAYQVFQMEMKGPQKAWGRELNEGENIMPSPILGFIALALLGFGGYLISRGWGFFA